MKKIVSLLLVITTLCSCSLLSITASAADYPGISKNAYIEFMAQQNINVYKDTACKTRGTSSPSKAYNASVSKNDICYIYKITSSYIEVNYPTSSGRRTGYIRRSDLFDSTAPAEYIPSAAKKVSVYKHANGGSVAKGDKVWRVNPKNTYQGYYAVIYEAKSGSRAYKMAYVTTSDFNAIKSGSSASITEGTYYIQSALNSNMVLDISGASTATGANVQIWSKNNSNAQQFKLTKTGNYYFLTAVCSGKVVDVSGGSSANCTNVQQWDLNRSDAQKWQFIDAGNGYYYIRSALGKNLDVSGGNSAEGTNVQIYDPNGTNAQKWKLISVGGSSTPQTNTKKTMTNALYNINVSGSKISCGFDGYRKKSGRHEGIDFNYENEKSVYSLTDGVITNVVEGKNGGALSTIAIYDSANNKTVVYLHLNPSDSLRIGQNIQKGDKIGTEAWRGCSSADGGHTHVEVRNGKKTGAAKSLDDYNLENPNPTSYWNSLGYEVK